MVREKSGRVGVANEKMRGMLWRGKHKEFAIAVVMACAGLLPGIVLSTGIVAILHITVGVLEMVESIVLL
jgi:hypothetical protein